MTLIYDLYHMALQYFIAKWWPLGEILHEEEEEEKIPWQERKLVLIEQQIIQQNQKITQLENDLQKLRIEFNEKFIEKESLDKQSVETFKNKWRERITLETHQGLSKSAFLKLRMSQEVEKIEG